MRAYLWAALIIAAAIAPAHWSREYRDLLEDTRASIVETVRGTHPSGLFNLAAGRLRKAYGD